MKMDDGDIKGMICIWLDDMVLLRTRQNLKCKVSEKFKMGSYGDLSWFLSFKIKRTELQNIAK